MCNSFALPGAQEPGFALPGNKKRTGGSAVRFWAEGFVHRLFIEFLLGNELLRHLFAFGNGHIVYRDQCAFVLLLHFKMKEFFVCF